MISLYDHQKKAIEKMKPGSILVGGVGSGKTLTSLVYFYEKICGGTPLLRDDDSYSPMRLKKDLYVITTARKRDTLDWVKEAANLPLIIKKVDSWNRIKNYTSIKDAFFIFDEQRVVGSGVWVKSFLKIAKNNQWILLTATPADTWMDLIPVFIANGFYKNRTEFIRKHVVYNRYTKFPKVERYLQITKLIELKNQITVDMHFTRKTISHEKKIVCNFDKEKQRRVMIDRWDIYDDIPIRDVSKMCYLLRKVSNSDPDRLLKLKEILEKHKKVVLFYNFNYELAALRRFAKKNEIPYSEWNGHKHEPISDTDSWLYLVQYIAGSEGWNCIETNTVVFFSQNYSYRIMTQAAGRIDRLNTPFVDLYYYTFTSNSAIDVAIGKALRQKRKFNENRFTTL
jgi:superfamily II DNA or RNA helicase